MKRKFFERTKRGASSSMVKSVSVLLAFAVLALAHTPVMSALRSTPAVVYAETDEELSARLSGLYGGFVAQASGSGSERAGQRSVDLLLPLGIKAGRVTAFVGQRPRLCPGGEAVGVSIYTNGVLIVGAAEFVNGSGVKTSPAAKAGLRPEDVIFEIGGIAVSSSDALQAELERSAGPVSLTIERGGSRKTVTVCPERDRSGELRIGAWVRDSTVGVGTLSFFDEDTGVLAALGHPVNDADTGSLLSVKDGKLVSAAILGVTKGEQGSPGELHGTFGRESPEIGSISSNTELGIFGVLTEGAADLLSGCAVETAFPDEVRTGEAVILSAVTGKIEEYSCRILKTSRQNEPAPKGLVIEITDERLIDITGGIVQGMSGSPILQDGRLVGAVTHVFINDPRKGYGAYAYWMYKASQG